MTATPGQGVWALLTELAGAGIKLRLIGDGQLEVKAPGGQLSADLRARIAADKPALVAWLGHEQAGHGRPGVPGERDDLAVVADPGRAYEPFPLSDLQTSFLIGSREGLEHHVRPHQYLEFDYDELDPARFEAALNVELERQRLNLAVVRDDVRLEIVRDPQPVRVGVTDLRGQPADQASRAIAGVRAAMRRQELPLDRWPWLDVEICRYGEGRARLHYNNNNFFSDALGTYRFLDAVLARYHDPARPRPDLPATARDVALALAELEESAVGQAARTYWCDRIPAWPGPPELPLRAGAGTRGRSRLNRREFTFPARSWAAVKASGGERGLTASTIAYAAHAEVLAYWSGSRHFLLNHMISHRLSMRQELADVIGNFAALYPLEVDWRHAESFLDRARRLQARVIDDMAHIQWSGVRVLQALNQARRTPGRAACPYAIASAMFVGPVDRPRHSLLETPQVIFDCEFWELRDGRLWVVWDVIEEMFPAGLIDAMQDGYLDLLARLAEGGQAWAAAAPDLLPAAQRRDRAAANTAPGLLAAGHDAAAGLLHDQLPRRAAERPDTPAVITPGQTLSYADLRDRCAELAARLTANGVRPGDLVAVVVPKGWSQVVAVLAVLTAGGAYVPVDPDWPRERIGYLLGDTAARLVLTTSGLAAGLRAWAGRPVLVVDDPDGAVRDDRGPAPVQPGDLAYVIYTSGSTGQPKGAMLDHRGPLNTITEVNRRFGVTSADVLFGASSLCFDLSVYDIFGAVAAGGTLVLPAGGPPDPAAWLDLVRRHGVTVWNSVPALMQLLTAEARSAGLRLPGLRLVLLSGDWIPVELPAQVRAIAPNARIISLGGATEASIWSICFPVDHPDPDWASIPYGRPLANQSWHVLDELGRDAPVWTPGELYIGGAGVALGYLNDPGRTAAAFVTHPATGERLYRTGDLGRYLPSGDIEFLGRADFQVKIQGYRVEPGEVEHALLSHPSVRQAAVVARDSSAGRQLAAFVVLTGTGPPAEAAGPPAEAAGLRGFLAGRIPEHLVPSTVTVLAELPLSANGKVDRRALAAVEPPARTARPAVSPRTPAERMIAAAWSEVLGGGPVGVHDDFFELGGQSFAALRVSSLLAQRLGRRIPLGTLLERRTVAGLAEWLAAPDGGWSPRVRLRRGGQGTPWFLVHPAGGSVVCYRRLAELLDAPVYAFQAPGPANGAQALASVRELAGLYLPELLAAQPRGSYQLAGWSSGAVIAHELAYQLESSGERVERLAVIDSPAPAGPRGIAPDDLLPWFLEDLGLGVDPALLDAAGPVDQPPGERLTRLLRQIGPELDPAALRATFAVFCGVVQACHAYRAPAITAPVTVVRASRGTVSEYETRPFGAEPAWGWDTVSAGAVTTVTVPGTHHTLLTDPHVIAVSQALAPVSQG